MKTPLIDAVNAYRGKQLTRFHMPGHKGAVGSAEWQAVLPFDITEVEGADSLFHADGAIALLEQELARIYGARRTLLCAGGATLCIQTMLALACGAGGKLVISRNIHRSAVNAAALLDLSPVWVYPRADAGDWFCGRYAPADIDAALTANPDAKAVYITSPDYFGVMSDLAAISAVCRKHDVFLLVDNAHGAHLKFLPESLHAPHPLDCGASACADSLHKTMPAMTGGALLHLADERLLSGAKEMMSLFGSTSPSYPIMLSCEQAGVYAGTDARADFAETARTLTALETLARERGFALPEGRRDPAKLSLGFGALGADADTFGRWMRAQGIEPEYISETACVLMANGYNTPDDFARLRTAIERFAPPAGAAAVSAPSVLRELPRSEAVMRVREAVFAPREQVPTAEAVGRIAAVEASPCPPGVPLVMSGERVTAQTAALLSSCGVGSVFVVREK